MTNIQKVEIVMNSPHVTQCVKFLLALMSDIKAKNFVRADYELEGKIFSLTLINVTKNRQAK